MLRYFPLLLIILLAAAFAFRLGQMGSDSDSASYTDPMLGKPMPALVLPALDESAAEIRLADMAGKPYLLNVFASWCATCQLEHGELKRLEEQSGLPLYGIAWKDDPARTKAWLERMGNIYSKVGVDLHGKAAMELGLTGAPETYLIGADGQIIALYRGALSASVVDTHFLPAIQKPVIQKDLP